MATTSLLGISGKLVNVLTPFTEEKGIDWHLDINPSLTVQADPADIAEALGNVLDNAVRFARTRIEVSAGRSQNDVVLGVSDDGPGADPDRCDLMLTRGVRIDDGTAGTGLGLAISGVILEAYGGRLGLSASRWDGLQVKLMLPATAGRPSAVA